MSVFAWNDKFSVGVSCVDYQHRRLIELTNALDEAVTVGGDARRLREILRELVEYTRYHFTTEEELMRAAGPRLAEHYREHKHEHDRFTAKILPLSEADPLDPSLVNAELLDYLVRWLVDHILGSDKELGRLLAEAGNWAKQLEQPAPTADVGDDDLDDGTLDDAHRDAVERSLLGALRESETRFRSLADSIPVLIWVCEADGGRVFFNRPWSVFSGVEPAGLQQGAWADAVHPEDRSPYRSALEQGLRSRQGFTHEFRLRRHDGRYRWFLESTVVRLAPDGEFLGLIGSALDITERKRAEHLLVHARDRLQREVERQTAELHRTNERLEREKREQQALIRRLGETQDQLLQAEKMAAIGQLAAGVAHEINNPVGYIASNLHTLGDYVATLLRMLRAFEGEESALPTDARDRISQARSTLDLQYVAEDVSSLILESQEGTQRVKQIVLDLKDFSHVDESEWQWADLHRGLDSTLNVVHNELKYKAEVVKEYGELHPIRCLPAQLNQVFMNLLINAAQAIEKTGTITVRTAQDGDEVRVEVADTGKGIAKENLSRLFDPFFTTKPVGKGTGLGLSLAYGIVDKHGGRIEVVSEPGKGSTFRVWLPVHGPAEEPET